MKKKPSKVKPEQVIPAMSLPAKRKATITLSTSLWTALRHEAIEKRTSAGEIINSLIAEHFEKQRSKR